MPNLRFPSRCGRYWLELFWRRDANSNASAGVILGENGGASQVFEFERQASARAATEWIVEKLGGRVTWGPRLEGQQ